MEAAKMDRPYNAVRREHVIDVAYRDFCTAFEARLGVMDFEALSHLPGGSPADGRRKLEQCVGASGFALFHKVDHGALLTTLGGRATRARTYVFGNPLIAVEMTRFAPVVGLYVPPRLYVSARDDERTVVTYDVPSATVAQFGSPQADRVAAGLDEKIEALIADAARAARQAASSDA
jgi:uncharacterized protein (DUF302 family)